MTIAASQVDDDTIHEVVIVGAGAAGLMTAISAARARPNADVVVLEGARRPGAKILISGGGRCNVTNAHVGARDFHGDRARIDRVLRRLDGDATVALFSELGVRLKHEPEFDKLFPDSNRARDVLNALLDSCTRLGVRIESEHRVTAIRRVEQSFEVLTERATVRGHRVVLATGGRSVPKTGSDGTGYELAKQLGHTIWTTHPALVPLQLDPHPLAHLSGVSFPAALQAWSENQLLAAVRGPVLVTHTGLSGPAVLDISRWVSIVQERGVPLELRLNFQPDRPAAELDKELLALARRTPKPFVRNSVPRLPQRLVDALCVCADVDGRKSLDQLSRGERQRFVQVLTRLQLSVSGTRGFAVAEVTAGGVPLNELNVTTMESRRCPGLYLVGELVDVDGRIGGFNFQWAWSSGYVAGVGLSKSLATDRSIGI